MSEKWRRLLGSVAFSLMSIVLLFWRPILSGQLDLAGLGAGLGVGTLIAYRAWPVLDFAKWRRWKGY